jgi:DNA-binding response OmpR family regulator
VVRASQETKDASGDRRSVLVIDDDEATRAMVAAALTDEGYVVIVARDGDEGMRLALEHCPALIFLDLRMPRGSGLRFLEEYRPDGRPPTAVVVMTAAGDRDQKEVRARVDGVLAKPFDIDDLIEMARRHCRRSG